MNRRLARIKAVQSLFQVDMNKTEVDTAIENVLEDEEQIGDFLNQLVQGTVDNLSEIDNVFIKHLENWTLDRVGSVDRSVIRMGIFEMMFLEDIPINVTLNESVEVAKSFGGEESGRFVNGVLSKIAKTLKA
ncbi:MAG: transcription antitermination factor NusB [Bacillaceae bacterium]|nr:transcription antitermination factor NusB [Bacillaceae bacterium]